MHFSHYLDDDYFFYIRYNYNKMDNIYLNKVQEQAHTVKDIRKITYQTANESLIILHQSNITKFTFNNKNYHFEQIYSTAHIQQLETQSILLVQQLVDDQVVLVVTGYGSIFTIAKDGEIDIKAQNQDGIASASLSPTQQYLYLVTNNKTLIQLNKQFDLVNQIPLDEQEEVLNTEAHFSWRPDGNFFIINYKTIHGNKAVTKDIMMNTFISPAKSDPNADGLVQSVSEKGKKAMSALVAWQPSGSIVAGADLVEKGQNKTNRVIFWQKNGLRHLEFNLKADVQKVNGLFWSFDSSILFVEAETKQAKRQLLLYYRSNYHWYLKNVISLNTSDRFFVLNSRQQKHKLLIVHTDKFEVVEYQTRLPQKQFKHQEQQKVYKNQFQYFVDGSILNMTDLSKCFMPPPMSMFKYDFGSNIAAAHKNKHNIVIITYEKVFLYDLMKTAVVLQCEIGELKDKRIFDLHLLKNDEISLIIGDRRYENVEGALKYVKKIEKEELTYKLSSDQNQIELKITYNNQELVVNGNTLTDQCSSFIVYHQFLLFTVSTSHMYDKLFVINFALEDWVQKAECNVKNKLADYQTRDTLNHRLTERGSKIIAVAEGRVVFQLPRGNLQGIYPKIIMIDRVKKCLQNHKYKQAFETVRTHKLDFNLLYDINPQAFKDEIENFLIDLKRVDYINLLITQITETYSSQIQYILSSKAYEINKSDFQMTFKGKKVKTVCGIISKALRNINKNDYILSIYTSEIREGKLNDLLFQIKQLKKNEVQVILPPHIVQNPQKKKKKVLSPQQILEYVCWLVDANAIYQASLLTYDLQLAAITARCTQKDPKQYMPYHDKLKQIQNQVEFKKKICLDLKKYDIAAKELAQGTQQQVEESLKLIKKHKLFKDGLIIYSKKTELKRIKQFIVEQLLASGQTNQAYRVCQSIGLFDRALSIAIASMDTKKIKQSLQIVSPTKETRQAAAIQIIGEIKEQIKNRIELARLYAYVEQYQEAVRIYLRHNQYRKAYKYISKVTEQFKNTQMMEGFKLCYSVKRNDIIRDKKDFLEKYARLKKVHKHKVQFGQPTSFRPRQNDDMYSEVSMSSKAQSSYTISTTTGMRKKKDKKRSILTRNVKEGSPLQEEYLLAYIKTLQDKVQDLVKDSKLLIQHLICMNLVQQAETMRNEVRQYIETFTTYRVKSYARTKYEQIHPEAAQLYFQPHKFDSISIDSFNYLF